MLKNWSSNKGCDLAKICITNCFSSSLRLFLYHLFDNKFLVYQTLKIVIFCGMAPMQPGNTPFTECHTGTPCSNCICFILFVKRIVVHARQTSKQQQTHLLKQNFSETITPIDNSCMLLLNL